MGLIGGMARTAVVAGTATAVSNRVSRRQAGRWAAQEQPTGLPGAGVRAAAAGVRAARRRGDDMMEQLEKLGELRAKGILTEEEFAAQKAKLLA